MSVPTFVSAIVVTYGRPNELDGVLANLLNQDQQPDEIVVLDNDPQGTGRQAPHIADPLVRYHCPGEPLTRAQARNTAVSAACGDVLLFLDDYVRFDKYFVVGMVMNAFRPREVAGISFQVRNASSHELLLNEYPALRTDRWGDARDVCQLSGCAFGIRRSVFDELGGYDEQLFGGEEELDLALRVVKAGGRLRYLPDILVSYRTTMKDPEPTSPAYRLIRNHLYYALKQLPLPFVITTAIVWGALALLHAVQHQEMPEFLRGVRAMKDEGLSGLARQYRLEHPTSWQQVNFLTSHEGRVYY